MEKPWKNVPPTEISVYSPTHFVYPVSPRSIAFVASLCLTITFNLCPSTVYIEELIILKLAMEVWASKNYPRFQNGQRKRKIIISLILPRFSLNPRYICWAWLADKSEIGPMFSIVTFPLLNYFILGEKKLTKNCSACFLCFTSYRVWHGFRLQSKMIIFGLILTTFESSGSFGGSWGSIEN